MTMVSPVLMACGLAIMLYAVKHGMMAVWTGAAIWFSMILIILAISTRIERGHWRFWELD